MSASSAWVSALWFACVLVALVVLFAAGLRVRLPYGRGARLTVRAGLIAMAGTAAILANMALFRHDTHLDLTREKAFTPAPETLQVVLSLPRDVELVYFYQNASPGGRAAKTMVEIMGGLSPRLHVQTIDPDRSPGLANSYGVKLYNVALLISGTQRIEVPTTDDREIALGLLRLFRQDHRPVCFSSGHHEYDIDNFEFHTHFEGQHSHSHDVQGMGVVQMEQHGLGRFRRALERLGYTARKVILPTAAQVPSDCTALVTANPRTPFGPPEVGLLAAYLARGGALLMLIEPDFSVDGPLAALLARAGVQVGDGVVVDPASHYFTDEQMVAITNYGQHPATAGLALSFFPAARPLQPLPAPGVTAVPLFASSPGSRLTPLLQRYRPVAAGEASRVLAIAAEGRLDGKDAEPFRLVVVGDADFASNSFFPYLSNADLALNLVFWLRREGRGAVMKPPVEVLPSVVLTNGQMQGIFIVTVLLLPGVVALAGGWVWWRRRF